MRKSRRRYSKQPGYIRKPRRTYSKKTGYIVTKSASVFELVSLDLFVFAPILIKRFKYDTDLGAMLIGGFIGTAIWAFAFIGGACLFETDSLIFKILLWPAV